MKGFFRTISLGLMAGGLALVGYWLWMAREDARTIQELRALNDEMHARLAAKQEMIERLSRSRRIAHLQVTNQKKDSDEKVQSTDVLFIELDDRGAELARQQFTIPGDVLFVDAWTIKFEPDKVAQGDPLQGRSLVLLRRIYSDRLPPNQGFTIDTPGAVPPGYACTAVGRFEKQLWENFWTLAMDADKAKAVGVRVAQGEAVYKPVRAGQTYELIADAVGGLSLTPLPGQTGDAAFTKAGQ